MSDAGSRALDEQPKQPESSYVVSPVPSEGTKTALPTSREHVAYPHCWCEPTLEHDEGGAQVWVHREIQ